MTLQHPERYNALGMRIVGELQKALQKIQRSGEVRVMIMTGAGDKAFCAGTDLKESAGMDTLRQSVGGPDLRNDARTGAALQDRRHPRDPRLSSVKVDPRRTFEARGEWVDYGQTKLRKEQNHEDQEFP